MLIDLVIALLAGLLTALMVGAYRNLAWRRHWFDIPNQRSSHQQPIPRGAGIVFALVISAVVAYQMAYSRVPLPLVISLLLGCGVAAAGWYDDLRGLSARLRFLIYVGANLGAAVLILPVLHSVWIYVALIVVVALALTWWTNLYNFMDGINGIATLQGVFMMLSAMMLSSQGAAGLSPLVLACLLGFLPWNFPRAQVFMGDAGSAFLGFFVGVLALWSIITNDLSVWQWLIIGGLFIVDATYTLLVRFASGQRWYDAHRSHAYQHLADRWGSHTRVVMALMMVNVAWLLPLAAVAKIFPAISAWCVLLAYLPLIAGCITLKAGVLPRRINTD